MESWSLLLAATLNAGTVLALAALGLLINEKAGIVNLGAEGLMLCAAIAGFATVIHTGSDWLGFAAGMGAGALLAAVFGLSPSARRAARRGSRGQPSGEQRGSESSIHWTRSITRVCLRSNESTATLVGGRVAARTTGDDRRTGR